MNKFSGLAVSAWLGMVAIGPAFAQSEEPYEGPSILTRDSTSAGQRGGKLLDFQLWGEITGVVDNGLTPVSLNSSGQVDTQGNHYAVEGGFGASGSRRWESDQVSLDYRGSWRHYNAGGAFDGTDQFLDLQWKHRLSQHMELTVHEVGGISSLSFGQLTYFPLANTDLLGVPLNELFDNTTYFSQSAANLEWQASARLSFSVGGDGFLVRRKSPILVNTNGYRGRGDVAYRITRRQTVYLSYSWEHFDYPRSFGYSDINMAESGWSVGLGPRADFSIDGGAARVQSLGLITVALDPVVAAIVGQGYTVTTSRRDVIIPVGEARLTRRFATSALTLNGGLTVLPGDGVFLTSRALNAALGYSYVGGKRLTFSTTAGYSRMSAAGQQTIAPYDGYYAGAGMTCRLFANAHMEARYDFRRYNVAAVANKDESRVSLGMAISTGERPLAIW
ncbi:MAG: hypothetical protein ABSH47_19155 [Bryobacteraceae bacterium]